MSSMRKRLSSLCGALSAMGSVADSWNIVPVNTAIELIQTIIPTLNTKKLKPVKDQLKFIGATLTGVVEGRKEKILNKTQAREYIKNLLPRIRTLLELVVKIDEDLPKDAPATPKPTITIRPGFQDVSQEAQDRLQDAITDDTGKVRQGAFGNEELSPMEREWEESEFTRLKRAQSFSAWENNYYEELETVLKRCKESIEKLPLVSKKAAVIHIGPVIPTAKIDTIFRSSTLPRAGIKCTYAGGCYIFEEQLLLAIKTDILQDDMVESAEYKNTCIQYKKRLEPYKDIFYPIKYSTNRLTELEAELKDNLDETTIIDMGTDRSSIIEGRQGRAKWLHKQIELHKGLLAKNTINLAKKKEEFDKLSAEYTAFKNSKRMPLRGKLGNYTDRSLEVCEKSLEQINKGKPLSERVVLVSNKGVVHGQLTYYWIMQDEKLGKWVSDLSFSKIKFEILDWSLPKHSKANDRKVLEYEVMIQKGLVDLITRLKKKEWKQKSIEKRVEAYLLEYRKKPEQYGEMLTRMYADIEEIVSEEKAKSVQKAAAVTEPVHLRQRLKRVKELRS